jgi:hypothetical protein
MWTEEFLFSINCGGVIWKKSIQRASDKEDCDYTE